MENEKIIRCRDCRFFQLDVWGNMDGFPLIIAHEMCSKWGGGCKTSPDGFCYLAERRQPESVNDVDSG